MRGRGALSHPGLPGIMRVRHPITNLLQPERLRRQDAEKPPHDSLVVARSQTPLLLLLMRFGVDSQCRINAILKFRSLRLKPS